MPVPVLSGESAGSRFSLRARPERVALAVALAFGAYALARAWRGGPHDFIAYYNAGARFLARVSPYTLQDPTPFKYPPGVALFFAPLALLPLFAAKLSFIALSFLAGVDVYRRLAARIGWAGAAWVGVCLVRFHNYDFLNVQVNHLLLWALWRSLETQRERPGSWIAGVGLGAASWIKVVSLVALVPLVLARRWRVLAGAVLVIGGGSVFPLIWFKEGPAVYTQWLELMRVTTPYPAPEGEILQSVQAALWFFAAGFGVSGPSFAWAMAGLLSAGTLTYLIECGRRARRAISPRDFEALILAGLVWATVISPLAWKHNYLLLLPGVAWLWERGQKRDVYVLAALWTVIPAMLTAVGQAYWSNRSYVVLLGALFLGARLLTVRSEPPAEREPLA